jgi:SAM-dependent methyltransferase
LTASYERKTCRLCGGAMGEPVLDLGQVALSNALSVDRSPDPTWPLQLVQCEDCQHVQTSVVVEADAVFPADYPYRSGTNPMMRKHLHDYALQIAANINGKSVLEIGSNDGTLLNELQQQGLRVLGVDPAVNIARQAHNWGMDTIPLPFSANLAGHLKKVDCVVANHCLAHIDDLQDVVEGVRNVLKKDGVFVLEVGHILRMSFDCCYLEHLSYHATHPLYTFLNRRGFYVDSVYEVPAQGGSMRIWAKPRGMGDFNMAESFQNVDHVERLRTQIDRLRRDLEPHLSGRFAIYGAPAKLTTLLAAIPMLRKAECVFDDNPEKQGKWTPATHIPIIAPDLHWSLGDIVLASWNFADEIIPRLRVQGFKGKIIRPLPTMEIFDV